LLQIQNPELDAHPARMVTDALKKQDPFPVARKEVLRVLKGLQIASLSMTNIGSLHNDARTILFLLSVGMQAQTLCKP